jgi:transcriptional regulator GlxA family with amidase domain
MDHRIVAVISVMRSRIGQSLTLQDLAASVYISPGHLSHLFKEEVGMPPAQYLKSLKMNEAKRLLQSPSMSVKQVVLKLGIKDKSHFERDFKKIFGVTPAQYRLAVIVSTADSLSHRDLQGPPYPRCQDLP